uniref:arginine decarboxylase n=1 Tax=viral metagenome TaxID=1070528 RepID=A0A6C0JFK3_9ZZZZ
MILGNRIPHEYFITKGKGESNAGSAGLPFETGSYDAALNNAGIENCNVIEYTSVIPTEAKLISKEAGLKRLQWGEVLEVIKAQSNGRRGSKISAAVITTTITDPNGKYLGGFACEYSGSGSRTEAEQSLALSIAGMIKRRGYGNIIGQTKIYKDNKTDKNYIIHPGKIFEYDFLDVKEEHGSVFVALCFISYIYPNLTQSISHSSITSDSTLIKNHKKTRKNKK